MTDDDLVDPRASLSDWLEASPYDSAVELVKSDEFQVACMQHPEPDGGRILMSELPGGEWAGPQDAEALEEDGFDVTAIEEGSLRMPVDGDVVVSVPESDDKPALMAWRGDGE